MTVRELIAELEKMPPDVEVATEGCDCYGDVGKVTLEKAQGKDPEYVLLNRS